MHIVFFGAGAIGCHTGAAWLSSVAAAGGRITLIGRPSRLSALRDHALDLSGGHNVNVAPGALHITDDPQILSEADLIVLTHKAGALPDAIDAIRAHSAEKTPILSLLNGVAPVRLLRQSLPERDCLAGMVPYNVVWQSNTHLHRTGAGNIALQRHPATEWLAAAGVEIDLHPDLTPIQYGKLLLNLANPINALAGIPLYDMLLDRGYRLVLSAAIAEALNVYDQAGIGWTQVGPNNPRLALRMLRAPTWLFRLVVLRKQRLDRSAMTSMASDLRAGRLTEIDILSGEIATLGRQHEISTPVNSALVRLVKSAETGDSVGPVASQQLLREVGL